MATVESAVEVYDFESIIEAAAKTVIAAAFSDDPIETYVTADVHIERILPRFEILFTPASYAGHDEVLGTEKLEASFGGGLAIQIVVASDGYNDLATYRAKLRDVCARWRGAFDAALVNHSLLNVRTAGTSPTFATDKGYLASTLRYDLTFCVTYGTFADLAAAQSV